MKVALLVGCLLTGQGLLGEVLRLESADLQVDFAADSATFAVTDKRCGRVWQPLDGSHPFARVGDVRREADGTRLSFSAELPSPGGQVQGLLCLSNAEIVCSLRAEANLPFVGRGIAWPVAFAAQPDERLLVPHGPGYAFPCTMKDMGMPFPDRFSVYTRDFNMGVWAQFGAKEGYLAILETPFDALVDFAVRPNGLRQMNVIWTGDRGRFAYGRSLRLVFQSPCTPVTVARRYREVLKKRGYLTTLEEKKRANPRLAAAIDDLAGAPDVWCWMLEGDRPAMARELKEMGLSNFLFCFATRKDLGVWRTEEDVAAVAKIPGVIPCEYDIYADTMEKRYLDKIEYVRPYWSTDAADADDIVIGADGKAIRGWKVAFKGEPDGSTNAIGCAHICESKAPYYLKKRLGEELLRYPGYRARFLDVSGTGVGTCYHPKHAFGRRESAVYRAELFRAVQDVFGLVCGTEEDVEPYVASTCYAEGVMSAPRHRWGGGRFMWKILDEVPAEVLPGMDPTLRVPFWELVWHGSLVSYWYWTDYNNKFPKLWRRKDLINALTGTPPMYFFDAKSFARQKGQLMDSYRRATPVARATAFTQMVDFRHLSADRLVQATSFANGVRVIVNFSAEPRQLSDGTTLEGEGLRLEMARGGQTARAGDASAPF